MTELDTRDFESFVTRDELRLARATGEAVRTLHDVAAQLEAAGADSRATLRPWLEELFPAARWAAETAMDRGADGE